MSNIQVKGQDTLTVALLGPKVVSDKKSNNKLFPPKKV